MATRVGMQKVQDEKVEGREYLLSLRRRAAKGGGSEKRTKTGTTGHEMIAQLEKTCSRYIKNIADWPRMESMNAHTTAKKLANEAQKANARDKRASAAIEQTEMSLLVMIPHWPNRMALEKVRMK